MSVSNLFKTAVGLKWNPDADAVNAPDGALLRADNLVPDEQGQLTLRLGSSTLFTASGLSDYDVNSIYTAEVDDNTIQMFNIGDKVFYDRGPLTISRSGTELGEYSPAETRSGLDSGQFLSTDTFTIDGVVGSDTLANWLATTPTDTGASFAFGGTPSGGTGDVVFCDDAYQMFFARGSVKKKMGKSSANEWETLDWGLAAPTVAPTLSAAAFSSTPIAAFGNADTTPAGTYTTHEGTSSYETGYNSDSSGATGLTPATGTGRASISKIFTDQQDFATLNEQAKADTDLFDMFVWLEEPRKVDKITIMFGLNSAADGADPFRDDYYYFEFKVKDQITVDVKDAGSTGAAAYGKSVEKTQSIVDPLEVTNVKTPAEVQEILRRLGRYAGPRSRERADAQQASPAWTHFSVTRGQFNRVGGTAGKDWSTVTAFKIVYTALPGSTERIFLDGAVWFGGGARALTGTYRGIYRFVRDTGNYIEKSPPSPPSESVTVTQGNVSFTIPAEGVTEAPAGTNQIWVYLYGGFLDTWYRFAIAASSAGSDSYRIDEFTPPDAGGTVNPTPPPTYTLPLDDAVQRGAMIQQGLSIPGGDPAASSEITIALRKGELDVMIENEILEPGVVEPPNNIVAACGPWLNRMFCLTDEGYVYPSSNTSPSNFSVYHVLDLRRYGRPLWAVKTAGGVVCGFTGDIIRIAGTGEESADRIQIDLYPDPIGVGNPPVDSCVYVNGNTIIYRSADGMMALTGNSATFIPTGNTSLLWRQHDRHQVSGINVATGRFRASVDNGILYLIAPEGSDVVNGNTIYRCYMDRNEWCRTEYPYNLMSIHREPSGRLLAGTDDGRLMELDTGNQDDEMDGSRVVTATDIDVEVWTPVVDGGQPLSRKTAHDLQLNIDTGGRNATVSVYKDGATADPTSFTANTSLAAPFRINATDVGDFLRAQLRLTGSFYRFVLLNYNMSYRLHPQMMMNFDPGYIVPAGNGDMAWLQEVELDCNAVDDINMLIYKDDSYFTTIPIEVTPSVRSVYRVVVPRNTKARRLRLRFETSGADAQGSVGFEPYGVRYRLRPTGNNVDVGLQPLFPVGQLP